MSSRITQVAGRALVANLSIRQRRELRKKVVGATNRSSHTPYTFLLGVAGQEESSLSFDLLHTVGVELESNCSRIAVNLRYPQAIHSLQACVPHG